MTTLPFFWDGLTLRRSIGITNPLIGPGVPGVNEIPAAGPMDYYMNRLWYAQGRKWSAGDIAGGASGTTPYERLDAILNVTENPLVLRGDGFAVPRGEGDITALSHNATQDAALGQGRLMAFTRKGAHALAVPVTRADWIAADSDHQPLLVPIQLANGTASDASVVAVNGDLYYQSPQAEIRTLKTAVRQFDQPGNLPISSRERRLLRFTDKSLLDFGSGIYFGNRLISTALPILSPQGTVHQALFDLDFEPISDIESGANPVWEGHYEGLDVLQLFTGDFNGTQRAFAVVVSKEDQGIDLWELTEEDKSDRAVPDKETRITMQIEFPAFTWGHEQDRKQLHSGELWLDRVSGEVIYTVEYRPDGDPCWLPWHKDKICSSANTCEDVVNPVCYPIKPNAENYQPAIPLPEPPANCQRPTGMPSTWAFQFQVRLTIKGFCRVRGLILYAEEKLDALYQGLQC